jgi:hypothetical protein
VVRGGHAVPGDGSEDTEHAQNSTSSPGRLQTAKRVVHNQGQRGWVDGQENMGWWWSLVTGHCFTGDR